MALRGATAAMLVAAALALPGSAQQRETVGTNTGSVSLSEWNAAENAGLSAGRWTSARNGWAGSFRKTTAPDGLSARLAELWQDRVRDLPERALREIHSQTFSPDRVRKSLADAANGNAETAPRWTPDLSAPFRPDRLAGELSVLANDSADLLESALESEITRRAGFVRTVDFEYRTGTGAWRDSYVAADVVGAFRETSDSAWAWQLRGFRSDDDSSGANIGLLWRKTASAFRDNQTHPYLVGANLFADFQDGDEGRFWRASLGGEFRTALVDIFANYYLPLTDGQPSGPDGNIVHYTAGGYDFEAHIGSSWLTGYAGYYQWLGEHGDDDQTGGRFGVLIRPPLILRGSDWEFELEYDKPSDRDGEIGARVSYLPDWSGGGNLRGRHRSADLRDYFYAPARREYSQNIRRADRTPGPAILVVAALADGATLNATLPDGTSRPVAVGEMLQTGTDETTLALALNGESAQLQFSNNERLVMRNGATLEFVNLGGEIRAFPGGGYLYEYDETATAATAGNNRRVTVLSEGDGEAYLVLAGTRVRREQTSRRRAQYLVLEGRAEFFGDPGAEEQIITCEPETVRNRKTGGGATAATQCPGDASLPVLPETSTGRTAEIYIVKNGVPTQVPPAGGEYEIGAGVSVSVAYVPPGATLTLLLRGDQDNEQTPLLFSAPGVPAILSAAYNPETGGAVVKVESGAVLPPSDPDAAPADPPPNPVGCGGESAAILDGVILAFSENGECPNPADAPEITFPAEPLSVTVAQGYDGIVAVLPSALTLGEYNSSDDRAAFVLTVESNELRLTPRDDIPGVPAGTHIITVQTGRGGATSDYIVRVRALPSPTVQLPFAPRGAPATIGTIRAPVLPETATFATVASLPLPDGITASRSGVLQSTQTLRAGIHPVDLLAAHPSFLGMLTVRANINANIPAHVYPPDLHAETLIMTVVNSLHIGPVFTVTTQSGRRTFRENGENFGEANLQIQMELVAGAPEFTLQNRVLALAMSLGAAQVTARIRINATGGAQPVSREIRVAAEGDGVVPVMSQLALADPTPEDIFAARRYHGPVFTININPGYVATDYDSAPAGFNLSRADGVVSIPQSEPITANEVRSGVFALTIDEPANRETVPGRAEFRLTVRAVTADPQPQNVNVGNTANLPVATLAGPSQPPVNNGTFHLVGVNGGSASNWTVNQTSGEIRTAATPPSVGQYTLTAHYRHPQMLGNLQLELSVAVHQNQIAATDAVANTSPARIHAADGFHGIVHTVEINTGYSATFNSVAPAAEYDLSADGILSLPQSAPIAANESRAGTVDISVTQNGNPVAPVLNVRVPLTVSGVAAPVVSQTETNNRPGDAVVLQQDIVPPFTSGATFALAAVNGGPAAQWQITPDGRISKSDPAPSLGGYTLTVQYNNDAMLGTLPLQVPVSVLPAEINLAAAVPVRQFPTIFIAPEHPGPLASVVVADGYDAEYETAARLQITKDGQNAIIAAPPADPVASGETRTGTIAVTITESGNSVTPPAVAQISLTVSAVAPPVRDFAQVDNAPGGIVSLPQNVVPPFTSGATFALAGVHGGPETQWQVGLAGFVAKADPAPAPGGYTLTIAYNNPAMLGTLRMQLPVSIHLPAVDIAAALPIRQFPEIYIAAGYDRALVTIAPADGYQAEYASPPNLSIMLDGQNGIVQTPIDDALLEGETRAATIAVTLSQTGNPVAPPVVAEIPFTVINFPAGVGASQDFGTHENAPGTTIGIVAGPALPAGGTFAIGQVADGDVSEWDIDPQTGELRIASPPNSPPAPELWGVNVEYRHPQIRTFFSNAIQRAVRIPVFVNLLDHSVPAIPASVFVAALPNAQDCATFVCTAQGTIPGVPAGVVPGGDDIVINAVIGYAGPAFTITSRAATVTIYGDTTEPPPFGFNYAENGSIAIVNPVMDDTVGEFPVRVSLADHRVQSATVTVSVHAVPNPAGPILVQIPPADVASANRALFTIGHLPGTEPQLKPDETISHFNFAFADNSIAVGTHPLFAQLDLAGNPPRYPRLSQTHGTSWPALLNKVSLAAGNYDVTIQVEHAQMRGTWFATVQLQIADLPALPDAELESALPVNEAVELQAVVGFTGLAHTVTSRAATLTLTAIPPADDGFAVRPNSIVEITTAVPEAGLNGGVPVRAYLEGRMQRDSRITMFINAVDPAPAPATLALNAGIAGSIVLATGDNTLPNYNGNDNRYNVEIVAAHPAVRVDNDDNTIIRIDPTDETADLLATLAISHPEGRFLGKWPLTVSVTIAARPTLSDEDLATALPDDARNISLNAAIGHAGSVHAVNLNLVPTITLSVDPANPPAGFEIAANGEIRIPDANPILADRSGVFPITATLSGFPARVQNITLSINTLAPSQPAVLNLNVGSAGMLDLAVADGTLPDIPGHDGTGFVAAVVGTAPADLRLVGTQIQADAVATAGETREMTVNITHPSEFFGIWPVLVSATVSEVSADSVMFNNEPALPGRVVPAANAAGTEINAMYHGKRRGLHFVVTRLGEPDSGPMASEVSVIVHRDPTTSVVMSLTVPDPCEPGSGSDRCNPEQISTTPGWSISDYEAFCESGGTHEGQQWRVPTVGEAALLVYPGGTHDYEMMDIAETSQVPVARKIDRNREIPGFIINEFSPQMIPLPAAGETDSPPIPAGGAVAVYGGVSDANNLNAAAFYATGNGLAVGAFTAQRPGADLVIRIPETESSPATDIIYKTFLRGAEGVAACVLEADPDNYAAQPKLAILHFEYGGKQDGCALNPGSGICTGIFNAFAARFGIVGSHEVDETFTQWTPDANGILATLTLNAYRFGVDTDGVTHQTITVIAEADEARLRTNNPLVTVVKLSEADDAVAHFAVSLAASVPAGTITADIIAAPRVGREARIVAQIILESAYDSTALPELPLQFAGEPFAAPDDRVSLILSAPSVPPNANIPDNWDNDFSDISNPPQEVEVVYHGKRRGLHFAYVSHPMNSASRTHLPNARWRELCDRGGNGGNGNQWRIPAASEAAALVQNDAATGIALTHFMTGWGFSSDRANNTLVPPPLVPGETDAAVLDAAVFLPHTFVHNILAGYNDGIAHVAFYPDSANQSFNSTGGIAGRGQIVAPCVLSAANYRGHENNANIHHTAPVIRAAGDRPDFAATDDSDLQSRTVAIPVIANDEILSGLLLSLTVRAERRFGEIIPETSVPLSIGVRDPGDFFQTNIVDIHPGEKIIVAEMTVAMQSSDASGRTLFIDAEVPQGQSRTATDALRFVVVPKALPANAASADDYALYLAGLPASFTRNGADISGRLLVDPEHSGHLITLSPFVPELPLVGVTLQNDDPPQLVLLSEHIRYRDETRTTDDGGIVSRVSQDGLNVYFLGGCSGCTSYDKDGTETTGRENQVDYEFRNAPQTVTLANGGRILSMPDGFGDIPDSGEGLLRTDNHNNGLQATIEFTFSPGGFTSGPGGRLSVGIVPYRPAGIRAFLPLSQATLQGRTIAAFGKLEYARRAPPNERTVSEILRSGPQSPALSDRYVISTYADGDILDPFEIMPNGEVRISNSLFLHIIPGEYKITAHILDAPDDWIAPVRVLTLEVAASETPGPVGGIVPVATRDLFPLVPRPVGAGFGADEMLPPETRRIVRVNIPEHRAVLAPDYTGDLFTLSVALPRGYEMQTDAAAFADIPNAGLRSCEGSDHLSEYGIETVPAGIVRATSTVAVHLRTQCPVRFRFTATTGLTLVASHPLYDETDPGHARTTIDIYAAQEQVGAESVLVHYERQRNADAVGEIPLEIIRLRPPSVPAPSATTFYQPVESFNPAAEDVNDFIANYPGSNNYRSLPQRTANLRRGRPSLNTRSSGDEFPYGGSTVREGGQQFIRDYMEWILESRDDRFADYPVFQMGGADLREQVRSLAGEATQYELQGDAEGFEVLSNGAVMVTTFLETDIANGRTYDFTVIATAPGVLGTLAMSELQVMTVPEFTVCPPHFNAENFNDVHSLQRFVLPPIAGECPPVHTTPVGDFSTWTHDRMSGTYGGRDQNRIVLQDGLVEELRAKGFEIRLDDSGSHDDARLIVSTDTNRNNLHDEDERITGTEIKRASFRITVYDRATEPRVPREFWRVNIIAGGPNADFTSEE